jgi:translation initiation factor 3 subunit D
MICDKFTDLTEPFLESQMTFTVDFNANTWGPSLTSVPQGFQDIPYAPFSKSDKIGRVADWYDHTTEDRQDRPEAHRARFDRRRVDQPYGAASTVFSYVHEEDEASFSLVDRGAAAPTRRPQTSTAGGKGSKTTISKPSSGSAQSAAQRAVWVFDGLG